MTWALRRQGGSLLRDRRAGTSRVTFMELFFDLVYVFAVTQLSHLLLDHLTWHGALQTLLLLLAVWWAWVYTAWATNWFDPDRRAVRLMLAGVMLASLLMSVALPDAFGARGLLFAGAYAAIQVGRCVWMIAAFRDQPGLRRNFQRVLAWLAAAAVLWVAGGFAPGPAREALWVAAVLVDYLAPAVGFRTPGLGRSTTADWTITGGHLAERCQLFVIIALGESILVTGATVGGLALSPATVGAFVTAFVGSVALWWVYFDRAGRGAAEAIAASTDPGRLGRSAYTYVHLPMVAGIIVTAVGDELVITHPTGPAHAGTVAVVLGGPALFLAGHTLFKWAVFHHWSVSRLAAIGALALLVPAGQFASALALAAASALVLIAVCAVDTVVEPSGG